MAARQQAAAARRGGDAGAFGRARALQLQGKAAEAEQAFRAALAADPRHPGALCSLALLCLQRGGIADGLGFAERALAVQPAAAQAHHLRALLLQAAGNAAEAEAAFRRAIRHEPGLAEAHANLGALLSGQGRHPAARASLAEALRLRPELAEARNNLGVSLLASDDAEAALAEFERAASLQPANADTQGNRGSALIALGRLPEACAAFEQAIALAPQEGQFYLDLARARGFAPDEPLLGQMQALAAKGGLDPASRIALEFALGTALDGMGETAQAFRHFRQGNALKRVNTLYDETSALGLMRRLPALFPAARLRAGAADGGARAQPVFVVGMPRSGTTLVEQILASHPAVSGAGERTALHEAARAAAGPGTPPGSLFEALSVLPGERLRGLGADYAAAMAALAPGAARVVDKMPANFLLLGVIALALPQARIIHVRRDAADTCLSCFATLFSGHQPYTYNLAELGHYWRGYDALMDHWRAALPPGMLLEVAYEDLVAGLEGEARRMVAHCGLGWDPRCLDFTATRRSVQTASRAQVRRKLYRSSVGRAQAYGALLGPLLQALGRTA